jgi:hypothetical protein
VPGSLDPGIDFGSVEVCTAFMGPACCRNPKIQVGVFWHMPGTFSFPTEPLYASGRVGDNRMGGENNATMCYDKSDLTLSQIYFDSLVILRACNDGHIFDI